MNREGRDKNWEDSTPTPDKIPTLGPGAEHSYSSARTRARRLSQALQWIPNSDAIYSYRSGIELRSRPESTWLPRTHIQKQASDVDGSLHFRSNSTSNFGSPGPVRGVWWTFTRDKK